MNPFCDTLPAMDHTSRRSLLTAARVFMRTSAVVAIAPLAAVTLASTAKAQTVFFASGNSGFTNYSDGRFSSSGFSISALPTFNNITGVKEAFSGSFIALSGFTGQSATLAFGDYGVSGIAVNSGVNIPIAYDFSLIPNGATTVTWSLSLDIGGSNQTVASGTGTGLFTGTGSFAVGSTITPPSFYSSQLNLVFTTAATSQGVSVVMDSSTAAFSINPATVPEPVTTSFLFGLGALGLVLFRRSRRAATA